MEKSLEERVAELESNFAVVDTKRQKLEDIVGDLLLALTNSEEHDSLRASVSIILEEYRESLR